MEMSTTIGELAKALCKTQAVMETAKKDSTNPHFNSKYSDIASCWEACRKPLSDNGLSVSQFPETDENGKISLTTVLLHTSGEWMRGTLSIIPKDGSNPQVFGSIVTYFRRYGLQSAVGIASDDDDGNAGAGSQGASAPAKRTAPAPSSAPSTPPPAPSPTDAPLASSQDMTEMDMRDETAVVLSKIADLLNASRKPEEHINAGDVLYGYTVSKSGQYGKRKVNDVPFTAAKKAGGTWNPLEAVLSKAKKELAELESKADEEVAFG